MIALTGISGYFFSYRALKPIQDIVKQANSISAENLSQRITIRKERDEIYDLSITFNEMLNRLENAFEMQKNFVANVSHELRTPLTSITGQLEVNLMNTRTIDEYKETITSILFDIKTLNQIVNNLLYLTETRLDKSNIPMTSLRVDELLYLAKILELKKHNNYTIDFNLSEFPEEESQLTILGNEQLLTVVFLNLLDNACKYSLDNKVTVSIKAINSSIVLTFIDTGIGIPETDLNVIFLPFHRGTNSKEIKGHGIGLSLVKNIIEIHGGSIAVNSIEGQGSTFTITLQNHD
jgi:signal transduction histidine kinase